MICEIHPFLDGNGRIARVMINAELVSANQSKIIPNECLHKAAFRLRDSLTLNMRLGYLLFYQKGSIIGRMF